MLHGSACGRKSDPAPKWVDVAAGLAVQVRGVAARSQALHDHVAWIAVVARAVGIVDVDEPPVGHRGEGLAARIAVADAFEVPAVGKPIEVAGGLALDAVGLDDRPRLSCRERQLDHQIARLHLADRVGGCPPDELAALEPRHAPATIDRVDLIGDRITEIALLPVQLRPPLPDEAMDLVGAGARMPVDGAALVVAEAAPRRRGSTVSAMVGCPRKPAAPPSWAYLSLMGVAQAAEVAALEIRTRAMVMNRICPSFLHVGQSALAGARCRYFAHRNPAADASPMLLGAPFWSIAYTPASSPNPPLPNAKLPPRSVVPGSP